MRQLEINLNAANTVARRWRAARDQAMVAVTDHGPGIRPEHRGLIFEKPRQPAGEKPVPGTGLGLIFCKLAVEAQGGNIGVESRADEDNTFWFTLPLSSG